MHIFVYIFYKDGNELSQKRGIKNLSMLVIAMRKQHQDLATKIIW